MPFFDFNYLLFVGPFMLISLWASWRVKSTFHRFQNVGVRSGMTGAEAAAAVARAGGANDITIERVGGFLSDHYDPRSKTLRLSPDVFDGRSISSIAVGAHEAGHAIQHARAYAWLGFRSQMVPVASVVSNLWIWVVMAGLFLRAPMLMYAGIALFAVVVVVQLITLPVEFDASNRAKAVLASSGIVSTQEEAQGVSKVLGAAAMTYVAGALTAIATLIYYLMLANRSNRGGREFSAASGQIPAVGGESMRFPPRSQDPTKRSPCDPSDCSRSPRSRCSCPARRGLRRCSPRSSRTTPRRPRRRCRACCRVTRSRA